MPTLTDITLRNLKPPQVGQKTYVCDSLPGFGCRVSPGGTKTFVLVHGDSRQRITIGRHPVISLSEARAEAKRILAEMTLGKHRPKSITWSEALKLYLAACEQKNRIRTVRDYTRLLKKHFPFGRKWLTEITKHDIIRAIDRLTVTPAEQNHAITAVKIFFKWALRRGYVDHSPCDGLQTSKRPPRERVLSEKELKAVLKTALKGENTFSFIVALLVTTGQRKGEITALRKDWVDAKALTVTLPATVTKNGRTHTFPCGDMTAHLLKRVPTSSDEYFFPSTREHVRGKPSLTYNGWSKDKLAFDKSCGVLNWTLHDLRRTFASNLAALGVSLPTIEKLLNHVSGSFGGIVAVYQRHNWLPEMRDAVSKWEGRLACLVGS